jgi:hypothetical protein
MFCKPIALVSARCHLGQHDLCVAERCDCDCHLSIAIGNPFWNRVSGRNGDESQGKSLRVRPETVKHSAACYGCQTTIEVDVRCDFNSTKRD